jgi:hypothetical protein
MLKQVKLGEDQVQRRWRERGDYGDQNREKQVTEW